MQAMVPYMVPYNIKDSHSKTLEPDCLSPFACNCDTVSKGRGELSFDNTFGMKRRYYEKIAFHFWDYSAFEF